MIELPNHEKDAASPQSFGHHAKNAHPKRDWIIPQFVTAFDHISDPSIGWGATIIATVVSGLVAYATIAWLLRFVSSNKFTGFLIYRVALGVVIIALLATGTVSA